MRAIIFDLGNVVCFFDHRKALGRLSRFTSMTPEEMYAAMYDSPVYDRLERGQIGVPAFLQHARQLWQVRCDAEVLVHAISDIFTLNPEVADLIPKLRERYRLVIGSNTNAIHARQFLKQFPKVLGQFHAIGL